MARHWDTYNSVTAFHPSPDDGTTFQIDRAECTPYEWELLVKDAQCHKWWEENMIRWGKRDHVAYPRAREIATLSLCLACDDFTGVETEGTTEQIVRSRCLDCEAITVLDMDKDIHSLDGP